MNIHIHIHIPYLAQLCAVLQSLRECRGNVINVGVNIALHHRGSGAFIVLYVWLPPLLVHRNLHMKALLFEVACCIVVRVRDEMVLQG
jgi:hypothetical protein